jgi:hypothetical protein
MNSRFFCFSLSFGVGRSVFRSECVFLSKAVTQTISIDTQTREKKSGRAPYWFVSPFNNISVLIDTKEEKNKNLHSLCRDKRRQDVRQQAKHLRRLMKTKIGSFGRVVKDRHTAHKV